MDCERFDDSVMDALYGELDELSAEALKRHVDGCTRCSAQLANFKATRAAIQLPVVEPSDTLTERIMEAEGRALRRLPWHRKVVRAAAWAGSHAMRPQLAMAALFMFVIGSSMMLLRAKPGSGTSPVTVRDEGRPLSEDGGGERRSVETDALQADEFDYDDRARGARAPRAEKAAEEKAAAPEAAALEAKSGGAASARAFADASSAPLAEEDAGTGGDAQEGLARGLSLKGSGNCDEAMATLRAVEQQYPGSKEAERAKAERAAGDCVGTGTPNAAPSPPATATASAEKAP